MCRQRNKAHIPVETGAPMLLFTLLVVAIPLCIWGFLRCMGFVAQMFRPFTPYLLTTFITFFSYFICFRVLMPYAVHPYRWYSHLLHSSSRPWKAPPSIVTLALGTIILFIWFNYFYKLVVYMIAQQNCSKFNKYKLNRKFLDVYAYKMTLLSMLVFIICFMTNLKHFVGSLLQKVPFGAELTIGAAILLVHLPLLLIYYQKRINSQACLA